MIDPEVMQATRDFHDEIIIVLAQVAKDIMDDTKHLNPPRLCSTPIRSLEMAVLIKRSVGDRSRPLGFLVG